MKNIGNFYVVLHDAQKLVSANVQLEKLAFIFEMPQSNIRTPVLLYRHLLKCIKQLPSETQGHYKHHVRQVGLSKSNQLSSP